MIPAISEIVEVEGRVYSAQVRPNRPRLSPQEDTCGGNGRGYLAVNAPLAGCLTSVSVAAGDHVQDGQVVAVLESMKMQMELRSPGSAVVEAVHQRAGMDVSQGECLLTLRTT